MNNINLSDYYLDIKELSKLSDFEKESIHSYYRDMLMYSHEKRYVIASSYFNTLQKAGYVKNATQESREEKLGELING
jgi:hypothetical protein